MPIIMCKTILDFWENSVNSFLRNAVRSNLEFESYIVLRNCTLLASTSKPSKAVKTLFKKGRSAFLCFKKKKKKNSCTSE